MAQVPLEYSRCFTFSPEPEIATVKPVYSIQNNYYLKQMITNDFQPKMAVNICGKIFKILQRVREILRGQVI